MRKLTLALIVLVAAVILWLPLRRPAAHRLSLTTYFNSGNALQPGATVRVDGVDLGSVKSVRVRPELGQRPVEVIMAIASSYDLAIPSDSTATLSTAGIFGPTVVDIDTRHAHGSRIGNNGVLTSSELTDQEQAEAIRQATKAMNRLTDQVAETGKKLPAPDKKPDTAGKPNTPTK